MTSGFNRRRFKYSPSPFPSEEYSADCIRIQEALLRELGLIVSISEVYWMWLMYSSDLCAGWINLPETDKEIVEVLIDEEN